MINFEEELKRFQPIPEVNQAEDAIYSNDLKDISDIVFQVTEEMKTASEDAANRMVGRVRR
ncbi:MAG: hypothetical protein IJ054_00105 [Lachnospiraceae bacterium]|nr:hypothetical protein [Lachnospiraceae bacterium]MBQ9233935.1 hypothetical protein [Lachnospiraceae bacterium]